MSSFTPLFIWSVFKFSRFFLLLDFTSNSLMNLFEFIPPIATLSVLSRWFHSSTFTLSSLSYLFSLIRLLIRKGDPLPYLVYLLLLSCDGKNKWQDERQREHLVLQGSYKKAYNSRWRRRRWLTQPSLLFLQNGEEVEKVAIIALGTKKGLVNVTVNWWYQRRNAGTRFVRTVAYGRIVNLDISYSV